MTTGTVRRRRGEVEEGRLERAGWRGQVGEGWLERAGWRGQVGEDRLERAGWRGGMEGNEESHEKRSKILQDVPGWYLRSCCNCLFNPKRYHLKRK